MFQKAILYYNTTKYLKWTQIRFQIWYKMRKVLRKWTDFKYDFKRDIPSYKIIVFEKGIENNVSYSGNNEFEFLNIRHNFSNEIDWEFGENGKLWTYNLNYFEFLHQTNAIEYQIEFNDILDNYIVKLPQLKNANEPFPTSLRIINWVKYFIDNDVNNVSLIQSLYSQLYILADNKEFHLLGNHLLENGFALTFGGVYFQDKNIYEQGRVILEKELEAQILNDGAHFELSPMYHSLMLFRMLDLINMLKSNDKVVKQFSSDSSQFVELLEMKAKYMCGWLKSIMYDNGDVPHFNDSTYGIAPDGFTLMEYAKRLSIRVDSTTLNDSGFRRLKNQHFDVVMKLGKIGSDYIPGHAHADSLTFECQVHQHPFLVDMGISTYEKNEIRHRQRSTFSHNTVSLHSFNSSEVWDGFRVGKRAYSAIEKESQYQISAFHNGYKTTHHRSFRIENNSFKITDKIDGDNAVAHFHFHPNIELKQSENEILANNVLFRFDSATEIKIKKYSYAEGFNKVKAADKLEISFANHFTTTINI